MFDHVTIRASDRAASERFYRTVLAPLGIDPTSTGEHFTEWDDFSLAQADEDHPVTRRLHIGFVAPSRPLADDFWSAGIDAGYRDDGEPGPRRIYGDDYYGAFLLDPDGNSAEAVHHDTLRSEGFIDHLWIRIADVSASKRFYEAIAPHAGIELGGHWPATGELLPERANFRGASGSFSVVAGEPTEHLHMAFPAASDDAVDAFHRAATDAGHRDNGAPAERPAYHPGYYSAFVLDPDGNNIEVVNHNR
jgi:catechol 2,3-dioxygenase-like lactoylglutathione lyase family enzyme